MRLIVLESVNFFSSIDAAKAILFYFFFILFSSVAEYDADSVPRKKNRHYENRVQVLQK